MFAVREGKKLEGVEGEKRIARMMMMVMMMTVMTSSREDDAAIER